jgi:hypothetical protein
MVGEIKKSKEEEGEDIPYEYRLPIGYRTAFSSIHYSDCSMAQTGRKTDKNWTFIVR